ncbi:MAG: ImmA/IrrE family metallo-endopeptidase [Chloroflexi bacterium]|nr:ImmA/IrrE family metallo-endopeptidase [Chloroflexota bacterium]
MAAPLLDVSPSALAEARQQVSLSVADAVLLLNRELKADEAPEISDADVEAWEAGRRQPNLVEAEALARVLLMPFVSLFGDHAPAPAIHDFRLGPEGRARGLSYATHQRLAEFVRLYRFARRLTSTLEAAEGLDLPHSTLAELNSNSAIESVAARMRAAIDLTDETQTGWESEVRGFEWSSDALQKAGIFVFAMAMDTGECRGASRWERGGPPAILVNSSDAPAAQLFSLYHEYAHLVLSTRGTATTVCDPAGMAGSKGVETMANKLAAAALIPEALLLDALPSRHPPSSASYRDWAPASRNKLNRLFRVSQSVIGIRLQQLGKVADPGIAQQFWRQPGGFARGKRRKRWQELERRLGHRAVDLTRRALASESLTIADVARDLDVKVGVVEALAAAEAA